MVKIISVMHQYDCNLWNFLKGKKVNFGLKERIDLAIKVVEEVALAHKTYIVHRDIKPSNIMLDSKMDPVLVDFGIGRDFKNLGGSVGTPGFTAPEQISGDKQDFPVDVFSLGKILVLIIFEWQAGWKILWSPERFINSKNQADSTGLLNLIRSMLQVE